MTRTTLLGGDGVVMWLDHRERARSVIRVTRLGQ